MIYPFSVFPLPSVAQVGGKGLSLMRLEQAGFAVPSGFVLSTAFFEPWMSVVRSSPEWRALQVAIQKGDDLLPVTNALKALSANLTLAGAQEQHLSDALRSLLDDDFLGDGQPLFAVRSSSPEEDLAAASFAGGYKTSLGVTKEALLGALRACFAAAFDERVFVYKRQQGFSLDNPRIAVVVQQQLVSESAGVGFSLNPLNNDYDEAVIDANWGLGESVVAGEVLADHFVVNRVTREIVERKLGAKATAVYLSAQGGIEERPAATSAEFCLTDAQVLEITALLGQIEDLYRHPVDIEWAYAGGTLYLLQARPVTAYVPLVPEMLTAAGERRILYVDAGLTDGVTTNQPMSPLTLDWMFGSFGMWVEPFSGPLDIRGDVDPQQGLMFAAGGRFYGNLSQMMTVYNVKKYAQSQDGAQFDALLMELMANIDVKRYRALQKLPGLRWWPLVRHTLRALWAVPPVVAATLFAFLRPEKFYQRYVPRIAEMVRELKERDYTNLSLREMIVTLNTTLTPIIGRVSYPPLMAYLFYVQRLEKMFASGSEEDKRLVESLARGFAGNEAVDIGVRQYRMAKMLALADFADLDALAQRVEKRDLPGEFLAVWDKFVADYGLRGPGELELANLRYGDDPRLALEQMSYMVDSDFDPVAMQEKHIAERRLAYEKLLQKLSGRKRKKLERVHKILDLFGPTRDTPKYLWVLDNGAVRRRALQEGRKFVEQGRLDVPEDIFWLTLDEIDAANANLAFDLRQARDAKKPFYRKLDQVLAFPHMIDSRGRIGQAEQPQSDPHVLLGMGISRGVARGRIKVLHTPREKAVEKGDVLVAYTTDPGWTPLFVNAEAIILEVGGMLQHGGVVAREYGKPCVAGIQGVTTRLQDGQRVEVDGSTGVVRILE